MFKLLKTDTNFEIFSTLSWFRSFECTNPKEENNRSIPADDATAVNFFLISINKLELIRFSTDNHYVIGVTFCLVKSVNMLLEKGAV